MEGPYVENLLNAESTDHPEELEERIMIAAWVT